MHVKRFFVAILVTGLMALIFSTWVYAQASSLTLYVFNQGSPVPDIEVLVDDQLLTLTDRRGVANLNLEPGIHFLELRIEDLVVLDQQILAIKDEVSQWIVDISSGGSAIFDVETSNPDGITSVQQESREVASDLEPGIITGKLINADDGEAISGARVFITGVTNDIRSDENGEFSAEVPPGNYSVSILHSGFNTMTRDDLQVAEMDETHLSVELTPAGSELPEFVVVVPHISGSLASVLEERQGDAAVANILGSEQISKAGDSDAASALKRVTGLTLVDGRFIFVRGLGERYSSTLLNGANVPSPDPTRRVVPLDLFPAAIIDSIAVQKSFTPEMPAEFGGGTVQIRTKSIPEANFLEVEAKLGYNSQTTGKEGIDYRGGGRDWTGKDDGTRAMSPLLMAATADGTQVREFNRFTGEGYTTEELEAIGESLPVNYEVVAKDAPANVGFGLAGGARFDLSDDIALGFLAALDYDDKYLTTEQQRTNYVVAGGELIPENSYNYLISGRKIDLGAFVTVGAEIGENNLFTYNFMQLRNTTDRTQEQKGFNRDAEGGDIRITELEWIERELRVNQFLGEHLIPQLWDFQLDWNYSTATANLDEPDTRIYRYDPDRLTEETDDLIFSLRNDSNQRRWGQLEDNSDNWNINLNQPLKFWDRLELSLKGGLSSVRKDRLSSIRRFGFQSKGPISGNVDLRRNLNPDDIIFDETIAPRGWQINEVTIATDAYQADQKIDSRYFAVDLFFDEWLRLGGGLRSEKSEQSVTTFDLFDADRNPVISNLDTDDQFASLSATLIFGDHQIRVGYGETINRPDFKELSPSLYRDPLLDRFVKGNPDLIPAYINNYDVRWDWYFDQGEFVSLGAFYKQFDDPVENVVLAGAAEITTFDNAESADNFGIEFEFYKTFEFVGRWWGEADWWAKWYLNTNYAWIDSEITLSDENSSIQTSSSRPLQGQSPYVWNLTIGYDDIDRGINAALLYNDFGERIVDVGTNGAPDVYQQPRPALDFVYSQKFRGNWKFKFRARNLLNSQVKVTQGSETRRSFKVGREYTVAIEWAY